MQKKLLLLLLPIMLNCGSAKSKAEIQEWISDQNFAVHKPAEWNAFKTHRYVAYTPLEENKYYQSYVSVFQFRLEDEPGFKEFVIGQYDAANETKTIISQDTVSTINHLGKVFIHKSESFWNGGNYKEYTMYFQYRGDYYHYNYSALKSLYDEHFKAAMSIKQSIRFKQE